MALGAERSNVLKVVLGDGLRLSLMGMKTMLDRVKRNFPSIQYGYFNRTRENFYPEGYKTDWPLPA